MTAGLPLVKAARAALRRAANPENAPAMQAYMKSTMPFWGVKSAERRAIQRELFDKHGLSTSETWERTVRELFDGAKRREERYVAIELLLLKRYRSFLTLDTLPVLEHLISTGAWWDFVDPLAADGIGHLLAKNPKSMSKTLRTWSRSKDMWKRRSSIIAQLRFAEDTDLELLYDCILPSLDSREFFLRKAIGWALRQYAWTDPKETKRYVKRMGEKLSPLSQREALKNIR
jgi:3-methyladenine DNA glycosylase AlkD